MVRSVTPEPGILDSLLPWVRSTRTLSDAETRAALARWVPGYRAAASDAPAGAADPALKSGAPGLLHAHEPPAAQGS